MLFYLPREHEEERYGKAQLCFYISSVFQELMGVFNIFSSLNIFTKGYTENL